MGTNLQYDALFQLSGGYTSQLTHQTGRVFQQVNLERCRGVVYWEETLESNEKRLASEDKVM